MSYNQTKGLATAGETIHADARTVWKNLVEPEGAGELFFGCTVSGDFRVGGTVVWKGEWEGQAFEDHGVILDMDVPTLFRYRYWSPSYGPENKTENHRVITYRLQERDGVCTVRIEQETSGDPAETEKSSSNWAAMLANLKTTCEK